MKKPLVSIIVPIFNTGKSAVILLDCLLQQSYEKLEIILVDDGSTNKDGFSELEEMAHKTKASSNKTVRLYHKKNNGASSARNYGLKRAKGEFVVFIDSDDLVTKDFIEKLARPLIDDAERTLSVCGFRYVRLKEGRVNDVMIGKLPERRKRDSDYAYLIRLFTDDGRFYSSVNKMYRTKTIRENKLTFDKKLDFAEDTDFVVQYLRAEIKRSQFPAAISAVREALYIYNFGTETSTVGRTGLDWKNWQKSLKRFEKMNVVQGADSKTMTFFERLLLRKLRFRFFGSHLLIVERSTIPESEKRKYVRPFPRVQLMIAKIIVRIRK